MPAFKQTSVDRLPGIDEATIPFTSLFENHLDRAIVEATVPLADQAIFIARDGRRFKFESISDEDVQHGDRGEDRRVSRDSPRPSPASRAPSGRNPAPVASDSTLRETYPVQSHATLTRRHPVSGFSEGFQQIASGRRAAEPTHSPRSADPRSAAEDLAPSMEQLHLHRFSDTPFYTDFDGGVLAAETLTDPDPTPRLPIPPSPTVQSATAQPPPMMNRTQDYQSPSYVPQPYLGGRYPAQPPLMTTAVPVDRIHGYYSPLPPEAQYHNTRHTSLPSLVAQSSPVPQAPRHSSMAIPARDPYQYTGYYHTLTQAQVSANFGSPPRNMSSPAVSYPNGSQYDDEMRRGESSSHYGPVSSPPLQTNGLYHIPTGESHFDTQTPVVVVPESRSASRPPSRPYQGSTSSRSDGASTGRDNVLPGEEVLFDGPVKVAQNLSSPFLEAILKVFRNTLTGDLRFHCKVGYDSETYWMKGSTARLIPVYAYDQRFPKVLYIRDDDNNNGAGGVGRRNSGAASPQQPGGFYQFSRLQELCDFQARLTGEKVVLDISSVRLLRFRKASSRSNESFSSLRVQIWHEEGPSSSSSAAGSGRRAGGSSDGASFVTAGTAVSGPLRERRVPNLSRLIVYLGRLDEYITVFITDDVEAVAEGQTMVRLRPRKGGKLKRSVSRWSGVKAHLETKKGSEPAGFNIDGQKTDPDIIYSFDLYESFDIEFESSPSQVNFLSKWDEGIKDRRMQRIHLDQIEEGMRTRTFTSSVARELW